MPPTERIPREIWVLIGAAFIIAVFLAYFLAGPQEAGDEKPVAPRLPARSSRWPAYLKALAVVAAATSSGAVCRA